jgi:hypothetical protein
MGAKAKASQAAAAGISTGQPVASFGGEKKALP